MAQPKTTPAEVAFALSLLKFLGVRDPQANAYLVLAVVAWMREASGGKPYVGNNPLNVPPGTHDAAWRIGQRVTKSRYDARYGETINTYASIYRTMEQGARAAAAFLKNGESGFALVVKAATRSAGSAAAAQQQVAIDFLNAIALSRWDAAHYGVKAGMSSDELTATNRLVALWSGLLGQPVVFPGQATANKPPPVPKPKPRQQPAKVYITPEPEYIQPYAAFSFYEERQWKPEKPPGEAGTIEQ